MWAGIAGASVNSGAQYEIAISIHDSVYNTDFASDIVETNPNDSDLTSNAVESHIIDTLREFSSEHLCKFLGAGVTVSLLTQVHTAYFPVY